MERGRSAQQNPVFSASLAFRRCLDFMLPSKKLFGIGSSLLREGRETSEQILPPQNEVQVMTLLSIKQ